MSAFKKWLIVAAVLIVAGIVVCGASATFVKFDFTQFNTVEQELNRYDVDGDFKDIKVNVDTEDVKLVPVTDGKCYVECLEEKGSHHIVGVNGDTLTIEREKGETHFVFFAINTESPRVTVYLPKDRYDSLTVESSTGDMNIPGDFVFGNIELTTDTGHIECEASSQGSIRLKASTGDMELENITAKDLNLESSTGDMDIDSVAVSGDVYIKVSTGEVKLRKVTCVGLTTIGSTGDIELIDTVASGDMNIERDSGEVSFDASDAANIYVKTTTGEVTGKLLTEKIFLTETDTGDVSVPKTASGGRCEITTDTGDIEIDIK